MEILDVGVVEYGRMGYDNANARLQLLIDQEPVWLPYEFYSEYIGREIVWAVQRDETGLFVRYCMAYIKDQKVRHRQGMGVISAFNNSVGLTNAWSSNPSSLAEHLGIEVAGGAYFANDRHSIGMAIGIDVRQINPILSVFCSEYCMVKVSFRHGNFWEPLKFGYLTHKTMKFREKCNRTEWESCNNVDHYVNILERDKHAEIIPLGTIDAEPKGRSVSDQFSDPQNSVL